MIPFNIYSKWIDNTINFLLLLPWHFVERHRSCLFLYSVLGKKTFSFFAQTSSFKCQDHEGSLLCYKLETEVFHDTFQDWASSKHCIFFLIENDCEAWNRKLKQLSIQQTIYILHSLRHIYRWDKRFLVANVGIWNHQNKHAPTPKGSRPYFDSSAAHIHTATISSVKQNKTNVTHLSRRNKATSKRRRPSRSLSSLQLLLALS